ncbi:MAG: ATP-binding protein [Prevotella sp.]|nr:ATP-binding protein [Prevotella sp.]
MLIRVVATNFRSYGQETEFNMFPSQNVRRFDWHVHNSSMGANVLRTAVVYGANGAGKSCLVRAIGRLQGMVRFGCLPITASRDANRFNGTNVPVTLEMEFRTDRSQYSYGVSYSGNTCVEEWLYVTKRTPKCIFERKLDESSGKAVIKLQASKKDEAKSKLLVSLLEENLLKDNELLLSKQDVVKNAQMTDAYMWIVSKLHVIYPETHSTSIFDNRYSNDAFKQKSENLIAALDLGINELMLKDEDLETFKMSISEWPELVQSLERIVKRLSKRSNDGQEALLETGTFTISIRRVDDKYYVRRVKSVHRVNENDYDFELKEESDGTQRIFDFLPVVHEVKDVNCTYIIDELDRSLHPTLVRALVSKIVTDKGMKGQLIFTTHDAGLLDGKIFRNDEIWFAEKDRETQNTHLYTLDEFKPRADLDIEKGYLNGRFGAIPFLAKLNELNWEE